MEYKEQIHYSELPSRNIYVDAVVNSLPGYYPARSEFIIEPRNDIEENLTNVCLLYAELMNEEEEEDDSDEIVMDNENSNSLTVESIQSNKTIDSMKYAEHRQQELKQPKHDQEDNISFTDEQGTRNKRKSTSNCEVNSKKRKIMEHLENSPIDTISKSIPSDLKEQVEFFEHQHSEGSRRESLNRITKSSTTKSSIKQKTFFESIDCDLNQTKSSKLYTESNNSKNTLKFMEENQNKIRKNSNKLSFNMVKTELIDTEDTDQSEYQNKEIKIENPGLNYEHSFDDMNNIESNSDTEQLKKLLRGNEIKLKTEHIPFNTTNVSNSTFDLEKKCSQIKTSITENTQIRDSHNCCIDCKNCQLNAKYKKNTKKDKQILLDLCLTTIEIYNNQLRERNRRKEFVRNHGFLDQKKIYAWYNIHNLELGEPFNVLFKKHIRLFKNSIEFDKFIQSLKLEKELKLKISQLDELRKNGIRYMKLIPIYNELNKQRNERLTELSKINIDNIVVKKEDRTINLCQLVEQKKPRSKKLVISHLAMYKFLNETEKELCEDNRLTPESFLKFKQIMIEECEKLGGLKLAQARTLFKIDVNKTRKIYDYLQDKKLIWK